MHYDAARELCFSSDVLSDEFLINSVLKEIEDEWSKYCKKPEPVKPSFQSTIDIREGDIIYKENLRRRRGVKAVFMEKFKIFL